MADGDSSDAAKAFMELDKIPLLLGKCTHMMEDENGVVVLRTESGAPAILMSRETYEEVLEWKKKNP